MKVPLCRYSCTSDVNSHDEFGGPAGGPREGPLDRRSQLEHHRGGGARHRRRQEEQEEVVARDQVRKEEAEGGGRARLAAGGPPEEAFLVEYLRGTTVAQVHGSVARSWRAFDPYRTHFD